MMLAQTPADFGMALRWMHVPVWVIIVSLVWFAWLYLRAGRLWLAWTVCAARTLALALNFGPAENLNYREITALRHLPFLGDTVSIPEGVRNPWMLVGQLSLSLFVIFVVDASLAAWRRGDRRQALMVGGSLAFFAVGGTLESVLVLWGIVQAPLTATLLYLGLVAVMGYQLSDDVLRASRLSDDLREREQQMALVADAADVGLWIWTTPQDTVWAADKLNPPPPLASGKPVSMDLFLASLHPEDREPTRRALRRALDEHSDYSAEYRVVLPDGSQRWIAASGRVERPAKNGTLRMLGASMDITRLKQAEDEVLRSRMELAHASRLSVVGELTASIAHEINQPLGAILSYAEAAELLAADKPGLDQVRQILAEIRHEDLRASDVIQRVRSLARKGALERHPVDLNKLVDDVLQVVRLDADRRAIELDLQVTADMPPVWADRVQLQQVILNLILNAMEAMTESPAKGRRVLLRMSREDSGVQITVTDAGPGIDPAVLPQLFHSFFTTKKEGMGLGLSIARSIIEAHEGRIWAENSPGGGAVFRVLLPIEPEHPRGA
jgi:signal transduction histidine kinase